MRKGRIRIGVALFASRGTLLIAMPSSAQAIKPRSSTQLKVSHLPGAVGSSRSKTATPTASSSVVSATPVTRTSHSLPRKYELRGMGMARSLRRLPSSRSVAMPIPMDWKLVDIRPALIIAATYSCETVIPAPWILSWKNEANIAIMTTGRAKVNATASLARKNCLSSRPPRSSPSRKAPGSLPPPLTGCGRLTAGSPTRVCVVPLPPAP